MHFNTTCSASTFIRLSAFELNVDASVVIRIDCNHHARTTRWVRHSVSDRDATHNPPLTSADVGKLRGVFFCTPSVIPRIELLERNFPVAVIVELMQNALEL